VCFSESIVGYFVIRDSCHLITEKATVYVQGLFSLGMNDQVVAFVVTPWGQKVVTIAIRLIAYWSQSLAVTSIHNSKGLRKCVSQTCIPIT